jgi:hypothetical protein
MPAPLPDGCLNGQRLAVARWNMKKQITVTISAMTGSV